MRNKYLNYLFFVLKFEIDIILKKVYKDMNLVSIFFVFEKFILKYFFF